MKEKEQLNISAIEYFRIILVAKTKEWLKLGNNLEAAQLSGEITMLQNTINALKD